MAIEQVTPTQLVTASLMLSETSPPLKFNFVHQSILISTAIAENIFSTTSRVQMPQIAKSSVESHDSSSESHAGLSSAQDNQHSLTLLLEQGQHFFNLPISEAKYWGFASDTERPSKPSDSTPTDQQTSLDLDWTKPRNKHLDGLQSEHELHSWDTEVNIPVTESTSPVSHLILAGSDDYVHDISYLSSNLAQDPASDRRHFFHVDYQLPGFAEYYETMFYSSLPLPFTLDSLDSDPNQEDDFGPVSGLGNTHIPQRYPFLATFASQSEIIHTPASLGWRRGTEPLKIYTFIVGQGSEPFFELLPQCSPTHETPSRVYLDQPKNMEERHYPCLYPGTCKSKLKPFRRPADLERHYMCVHADANRVDSLPCDYANCTRSKKPFTRRDHYRDHLRYSHKEDIGQAKGKRTRQWEANRKRWLEERNVSYEHWRCSRCLVRNCSYQSGWKCWSCQMKCEFERIKARERLFRESSSLEAGENEESASTSHGKCNACKAKSKTRILSDTVDKQRAQPNDTAIKARQVRNEISQATPQAPDTSEGFDIDSDGIREEIELQADHGLEHSDPAYQKPKHKQEDKDEPSIRQEGIQSRRHKVNQPIQLQQEPEPVSHTN